MDDSSHSVYLAANGGDTWEAWSGKTKNGGGCTGTKLGLVPHLECLNLDNSYSQRIRCVRYHPHEKNLALSKQHWKKKKH
ncbi:hypothetical protein DHEL01_v213137 [Diaporthe helianthi]|uniref:Uncharacterized protein n=1 Tax=Diaporthe helianthi TaxID=158607 RepID=A0A2P5HE12_DIAHE|nr:hypothetical protein DHEL01_v213137 [Diaporthe helianthi]